MKGIIVAAGFGTRFLPITKSIPKEMLPLIDKPAIAFIIEEFLSSGIKDIIIITSRRKNSIENYLDRDPELENIFLNENAQKKYAAIQPYDTNLCFVRQNEMLGSGHALLQAAPWLGNEPAIVAYPDDLHFGEVPLSKQLIHAYEKTGHCICAALEEKGDVSRYGVFDIDPNSDRVKNFIEKPPVGTEPSHLVSIGRYLFTNEYFKELAKAYTYHKREQGEFYHFAGLKPLWEMGCVDAIKFTGLRLDTGEPAGYLQAILHYAKTQPQYASYLKE